MKCKNCDEEIGTALKHRVPGGYIHQVCPLVAGDREPATTKTPGGKHVRSSEFVLLRCPTCNKERRVEKHETDPAGTVTIVLECHNCDHRRGGGTFDDPCYLDKNGKKLKAQ